MHDLGELILEGVVNSLEAGSSFVSIKLEKMEECFWVDIQDNGTLLEGKDFFSSGFSTKGENRGRGLSLIRLADNEARLYREDGYTILSFKVGDDGSLDALEEVLFPIFQFDIAILFSYIVEGKEVLRLSKEKGEELSRISEIAEFKHLIKSKIRSVQCQNSH